MHCQLNPVVTKSKHTALQVCVKSIKERSWITQKVSATIIDTNTWLVTVQSQSPAKEIQAAQ